MQVSFTRCADMSDLELPESVRDAMDAARLRWLIDHPEFELHGKRRRHSAKEEWTCARMLGEHTVWPDARTAIDKAMQGNWNE